MLFVNALKPYLYDINQLMDMKDLLFALLFISVINLNAQEYYTVSQIETDEFGYESMPAMQLVLTDVNKKEMMESFTRAFKKESKVDLVITDNTITIDQYVFKDISSETFKIFTRFKDVPEGVELIFGMTDSNAVVDLDDHINGESIKKVVAEFAKDTYTDALTVELGVENDHLKSLQHEYDKNDKAIAKLQKSNIKSTTGIDNAKLEIEINRKEYEMALTEYQNQKSQFAQVDKNDENYKGSKSKYKGAEKAKKDLEKEYLDKNQGIYDEEAHIQTNNVLVDDLQKLQESLDIKIVNQKIVVKELEDRIYELERE